MVHCMELILWYIARRSRNFPIFPHPRRKSHFRPEFDPPPLPETSRYQGLTNIFKYPLTIPPSGSKKATKTFMSASKTPDRKEIVKFKKALKNLTISVSKALDAIDREMQNPPGEKRGQRIATICNALDLMNDQVKYSTLGIRPKKRPGSADSRLV